MKKIAAVGLLTCAIGSSYAATIIDDFTTGAEDVNVTSLTVPSWQEDQALGANILGGQRDTLVRNTANPFGDGSRFFVDTANGFGRFSSGPGVRSELTLDYDGLDVEGNDGTLTASSGGLNKNFIADHENFLELTMAYADHDVQVLVTFETYTNSGPLTGSFNLGAFNASNTPVSHQLYLPTHMGDADITDIDRITFTFTSDSSADYVVSNIRTDFAVPEPASMVALAFGIANIVARRRKRA